MVKSIGTVLSDSFSIGCSLIAEWIKMSQKEPSLLTFGTSQVSHKNKLYVLKINSQHISYKVIKLSGNFNGGNALTRQSEYRKEYG